MESGAAQAKEKRVKRGKSLIRDEYIADGAILFKFDLSSQLAELRARKWRIMEETGFKVTTLGCLIPQLYYRKTNKKGDKMKGHKRAVEALMDQKPDKEKMPNANGWPMTEQVSHLCHVADCCNPLHLVIEAKWKNMRRNYCGSSGTCDCGMQPSCLRVYSTTDWYYQSNPWLDKAGIDQVLQPLKAKHPFKILPPNYYEKDDRKKANRNARIKAGKKTKEQAKKNSAKKAKTTEESMEL